MKTTTYVLMASVALAVLVPLCIPAQEGEKVSGAKLAKPHASLWGANSLVKERGYFLIESPEDLKPVWSRHTHNDHVRLYEGARLEVDFDRCQLVAIFQGEAMNTSGIECFEIVEVEKVIHFRFRGRWYQSLSRNGSGGGEPATAYGFFVIPRTDRPVVLEEDVQNLIGKPPVWKERARFEPKPVK